MNAILEQLGLDRSFFVQLAVFAVTFVVLSRLYFKPFQRLFEIRHKRTVEDQEAAERLLAQAQSKFEEYRARLSDERLMAKKEYEAIIDDTKKQEAAILAQAREEAKKITQGAAESVANQREELKKRLQQDVESMAQNIAERLLSRKA